MGTFTTGGIAAELEKFNGLIKGTDEACEAAVKAGAKVLVQKLKEAAPVYQGNRKDVKPGELRNSIKAGKVRYNAADGYNCEVGPTGKNSRGESLAKIGNILEYGRSGYGRTALRKGGQGRSKKMYETEREYRTWKESGGKYSGQHSSSYYYALENKRKENKSLRIKGDKLVNKHYSDMKAKAWFMPTVIESEAEVKEAMQKAFEEAQKHE